MAWTDLLLTSGRDTMITAVAIVLLVIFTGLVVSMALAPMMVEPEIRKAPPVQRPARLDRLAIPSRGDHHQQAA